MPEQEYISALAADLTNCIAAVQGREIQTIFFGGGTPSLFSAAAINTLLENISKLVNFSSNIEITLEANPATIEQKYLTAYKQAGITRVSIGAQSFQNDKLQVLERIHTSKEILLAVEKVQQAGFRSFNIDLMYGLPDQTLNDALYDLETAISCKPQHISWYELTLEPGTAFYANNIALPAEDLRLHMQEQGIARLDDAGFSRYEVSAYAQPGHQCRHNLNYWEFGDYLGIGAGAHAKSTNLITHDIYRSWKQKTPKEYLACKHNYVAEEKLLRQDELPFEFMLNALRLVNGFAKTLFTERTNLPNEKIDAILKQAEQRGLLQLSADRITPTKLGALFLNDVVQLFL